MSNAFNGVAEALSNDPELRERVMAAASAEERAAILVAAGLELPTAEEIEQAKLAGVAGGTAPGSTGVTDCAVSGIAATIA